MGHSDVNMIFRRYGKWIKTKDDDAGMKAVLLFDKESVVKLKAIK